MIMRSLACVRVDKERKKKDGETSICLGGLFVRGEKTLSPASETPKNEEKNFSSPFVSQAGRRMELFIAEEEEEGE